MIPVKHRHDKIIIVASGSSLNSFDKKSLEVLNIPTIAVNKEYWKFNADYWCTIDPAPQQNILDDKTKNTYKYVGYKEAVTGHNVHNLKRFLINSKDQASSTNSLLCEERDTIQTHNSSYAAFNLAYHMQAKKVLLLGVDANNYNYPENSRGWKISISKIPFLFETALPQIKKRGIEVVNGSLQSRVTCFDNMTIEGALKWIQQ